jgi:hypothetical protein
MSIVKQSKTTRAARVQKVIAGIKKYFFNLQSLVIGNVSYAPADLVKLLETDVAADELTTEDRAKLLADAEVARSTHARTDPVLRLVKMHVVAQFTDDPDAAQKLGDFGFAPRKVRVRKTGAKAAAAQKGKATKAKKEAAIRAATATPAAASAEAPAATPPAAAPAKPTS